MSCFNLTMNMLTEPPSYGGAGGGGGVGIPFLLVYILWVHLHSFVLFGLGDLRLLDPMVLAVEGRVVLTALAYHGVKVPSLQVFLVVK